MVFYVESYCSWCLFFSSTLIFFIIQLTFELLQHLSSFWLVLQLHLIPSPLRYFVNVPGPLGCLKKCSMTFKMTQHSLRPFVPLLKLLFVLLTDYFLKGNMLQFMHSCCSYVVGASGFRKMRYLKYIGRNLMSHWMLSLPKLVL